MSKQFVPVTPGDTICTWLTAPTEEEAWRNLLVDAAHMPYKDQQAFEDRGYTVVELIEVTPQEREAEILDALKDINLPSIKRVKLLKKLYEIRLLIKEENKS